MKDLISDKSILITGGTGSFGKYFIKYILENHNPKKVIVFSRDELKQYEMKASGFDDGRMRYFIGDVRDVERLKLAMRDVDVVIHAAALKHVPACEYNPIEAVLTNIIGTKNVIEAALDTKVTKLIALSTDKAVSPISLYGATKLVAEKLFTQANTYSKDGGARFSCVRFGNMFGSRGSVVPALINQKKTGKVFLTDDRMTRFCITLEQGAEFVIKCLKEMHGGEVFVPKIPTMRIVDLINAIAPTSKIEIIGIRTGEKLHEILISEDEARNTLETENMYIIKPSYPWWGKLNWGNAKPVNANFKYASDTNSRFLTVKDLRKILDKSEIESE